jgi:hypothetical protein
MRLVERAWAWGLTEQPPSLGAGRHRWSTPAATPQHLSARPAAPPGLAGSFLSDVALTTAVDHGCLVTISSVVELTCAADDRPWQFRQVGLQFSGTYWAATSP